MATQALPASAAISTATPSRGSTGIITGNKVGITIAAMSAALMSLLDISIVNVGLSDIRASFGTPLDQIAWVSTGYAMANITVIPLSGWLQRRYGIRKTLTVAIIVFTVSSALCGLAWNLPSLVIFRILQGMGGGAIIPTAQATLFARYPREQAGFAGAMFGLGAITGPLLGPAVGGVLIEHFSWHWMFYINLPLGCLAAFLAWTQIKEEGFSADQRSVDAIGVGLLATGMISLQYVLEEGNRDGWLDSPLIGALIIVAVVSLLTFVVHELDTPNPVVDVRVFKSRSYAVATGLNCLLGTVVFAGSFLYSLYCGSVMHYQAIDIGMIFLRGSWPQLLLMPMVGMLISKVEPRVLIFFGLSLVAASTFMNADLTAQADTFVMTMPIFIRGVGLSFCFVPLTVAALADITPQNRGNATGLFNATRELGGSVATAWMSTRLTENAKVHYTYLSESVTAFNPIAQQQMASIKAGLTGRVADSAAGALGVMSGKLNIQALSLGFRDGFTVLGLLFLLSLATVFFLNKPKDAVDVSAVH